MFSKDLRSDSGLSLVEVMVALAILALVGLLASQTLVDTAKHDVRLQVKQDQRDFHEEIKSLLKTENCGIDQLLDDDFNRIEESLSPLVFNPLKSSAELTLVNGILKLNKTTNKTYGPVEIQSLTLGPYFNKTTPLLPPSYVEINPEVLNKNPARYKAQLDIKVKGYRTLEAEGITQSFPVILEVRNLSGGLRITACLGFDKLAYLRSACEVMPGGRWRSDTFDCEIPSENEENAPSATCSVSDSCNVSKEYVVGP